MVWKVGLRASMALVLAGVILGVVRIAWIADHELYVEHATALAEGGGADDPLAEARLSRDQDVVFEVCADDPLEPARWVDVMALVVYRREGREVMTRSALTPEVLSMVQRDATHGCLVLGRGRIQADDAYTVEAVFEGPRPALVEDVTLTTRISARVELGGADFGVVGLIWLGTLGLVGSLALRPPGVRARKEEELLWEEALAEDEARPAKPARPWPDEARVALGLFLVVGAFVASGWLPAGAALGLAVGVLLALLEMGVGIGLLPARGLEARLEALGLVRPKRAYLWFPAAILGGVLLVQLAILATRLVPSTGQSAIQTFVSWPSGLLSFAALAVFAPLAEEVFFRGFVYGLLAKRARWLGFAGGWLLFVIAHLPQTFGQWGALAGILVTGLALTGLRAASGSTLVAAVAHLVYNGLLALSGLLPG